MARLHTKWNQKQRTRSYRDVGSVLAISIWKLSAECLLNLENEGFETTRSEQRLDVISEFSAYLLHMLDRMVHQRLEEDERVQLIHAVAHKLAEMIGTNRSELSGGGDYQQTVLNLINQRGADYADCQFDLKHGGAGFTMRRLLGDAVQKAMGDNQQRWIPDYVIDREAPQAYTRFRTTAEKMLSLE